MRKFILAIALLLLAIGPCSPFQLLAQCNHNLKRGDNDLGPILRLELYPRMLNGNTGYSALAEVGENNYRFNGTFGALICPQHLIKFSGEYLGQRLGYHFSSGLHHRWMHQDAVGAKYKYIVNGCWIDSVDIDAAYSFAHSRKLRDIICPTGVSSAVTTSTTISRFIAGSHAYSFSAGATILPWCDATLHGALIYDHVEYDRKFEHDKRSAGLGGSIKFTQRLWNDFGLKFKSEFRQPFNYYEGVIDWTGCTRCGEVNVGLFIGHTQGKVHLPSSTAYGVELGYSFGSGYYQSLCCDPCNPCCQTECNAELLCWLSSPAVRMPQVLAIADQHFNRTTTPTCTPPTSSSIPAQTLAPFDTLSFDISSFFNANGNPITFTATGLPVSFSIDSISGIISGTSPGNFGDIVLNVTVTGTTICGSTSETFQLTLEGLSI